MDKYQVTHYSIFLAVQPFPHNSLWLVEIYVRGSIPKLLLVRAIMMVVRNIAEDVKFIITTMACSVLIAVWHYGYHQLVREIRKG
jgi:hypothetical protein